MFNLENKITWKELAPSLQAMFKTLQSQITDVKNEVNNINISLGDINDHLTQIDNSITNIEGDITNINNDISEINNNIEEVTNITNNITGMFATGEQGQVVKIDAENNGLFADDNFHKMNVFDNNSDITSFKDSFNYDLNMQEIFNNWQQNRVCSESIVTNGFFDSYNDTPPVKNDKDPNWRYDSGRIIMSLNSTVYSMFISLNEYQPNINIELLVEGLDKNDDDCVSIIFGYKDQAGEEFDTLEAIINGGATHNQHKHNLAITYSFAQKDSVNLVTSPKTDNTFDNVYDRSNFAKIRIVKDTSKIVAYRTYWYETEKEATDADYKLNIEYTLPILKPDNLTQDQYNNMKEMFGYSKIGFGTLSWNCAFKVLKSNVADLLGNSIIYDLKKDIKQQYDSDDGWITASTKPSDEIVERTFLYNEFTNKFYFYYYKQNFVQIKGGYST